MRETANVEKTIIEPADTYSRTRENIFGSRRNGESRPGLRAELPDGFEGVYLFGSLRDFLAGNPNQFRQAFGDPNVDFR